VSTPRPTRMVRQVRPLRQGVPDATVARLPVYLRALTSLAERGVETVSSEELAAAAGVGSAKLRKDLSHLGSYGTRGVGYEVEYLVYQISRELGLTQDWRVVIVGIGNLGHALANYGGFASRGFTVVALLDADPGLVGERVAGIDVRPVDDLEDVVAGGEVSIGVVATPAAAAQPVCDRLVAAGVSSVLNFAPVVLDVPDGVMVRKVDLSTELQILAFHEQRKVATRLALDVPEGMPGLPALLADDDEDDEEDGSGDVEGRGDGASAGVAR
jgi:redox-sensing transcriptional repressor